MSGFLIDTNVISEPARRNPDSGVTAWFASADEETIHLSVITMGEIHKGIERVSEPAKKAKLEKFFAMLRLRFGSRVLPIDELVAERWGRLTGNLAARGLALPAIDSLIAATALQHDLTIVTRNDGDYQNAGVPILNPFGAR
jgi:predicted nucleic acid-binding protein